MYVLAVSYMYFQDFRDINLWYQWVYFSTARYKLKKKSLFEKHKYPFSRLAINKSAIPALQMSEHWPCEFFSSVNTRHVAIKLSSRWPKVTLIPHFCVFNWHIQFSKLWNCVGEDRTKIQKSSLFTTRIQVGIDERTLKLNRNLLVYFHSGILVQMKKEITFYKLFDRLLI